MTPVTRGRNDLWGGLILAIGVVLAITAFAGVSLFQIGAVAFFSWLALARKQGWAWIPAAFFGFHVAQDLLDGVGGSLFFPLMVVAAGVLMLSRDRLSKNATVGILIMLAVIGIASSNRGEDAKINLKIDGPPRAARVPAPPAAPTVPQQLALKDLGGRDLVIEAGSRDIELATSAQGGVRILGEEGFDLTEESREVSLVVPDGDGSLEIHVPAEANVIVRSTSGDVTAEIDTFQLDVDTVSGDIDVELDGVHALTAHTAEGRIEAEGVTDYDDSPDSLATEARGPRVRLESRRGTISISQA